MSGDKNGKISLSPNQIFKVDESDKDRDYLASRRRYFLLEQLSGTSNEKIMPPASITNTIGGSKIDSACNIQKCPKEVISSPSTATSNFFPFAGS